MNKVINKKVDKYGFFLKEKYRAPSRGGNTSALHKHYLDIDGKTYTFDALGSQRWVFKTDTVSFEYRTINSYNYIIKDTIVTHDSKGNPVTRGNRGFKKVLRTVDSKLPCSKREARD